MLNKEGDTNNNKYYQSYISNLTNNTQKIIEEDAKYFLHQAMSSPVNNVLKSSQNCTLITNDNQEIIDCHGNNTHILGYQNEKLIEAIKKQLDEFSFVPRRFTSEISISAAKKLVELNNKSLNRVLFTTSGSSSVSLALKITRSVTKKNKIVSTYDSFHGANLDAINIGGDLEFKNDLGYFDSNIHFIAYGTSDCPLNSNCVGCDHLCLKYLDYQLTKENDYGAIIIEPIRATTLHIPTQEYFTKLRAISNKHSLLLIFDEIPLSLGKTGKFFSYQHYDIEPDILILGKGLGASLVPFSAVVTKDEYNIASHLSLGHYTHEKNPLASAISLALIKYIEDNKLIDYVIEIEDIISNELVLLKNEFKVIKETRNIGNMFVVELKDMDFEYEKLVYDFLEQGINIKISQKRNLLFMPPLTITVENIMKIFDVLKNIIKKVEIEYGI